VIAAISDWRTRRVPIVAGYGIILLSIVFLSVQSLWWSVVFFILVIYGSRSPSAMLPSVIIWLIMAQSSEANTPFVAGLYLVTLLLWLGWFQGGDAQIAYGLMALGKDWWIFGYIFGGTVFFGILLMIWKRGLTGTLRRSWYIAGNLKEGREDNDAIRVPWAVMAAVFGLVYFWMLPGVALPGGFW